MDTRSMGFQAEIGSRHDNNVSELLKQVVPQDLMKYGLIPEFIGRVPVVVSLEELDKDALVRILTEPKNAIVRQYKRLFELDGVDLQFTEDAIDEIAEKTIARKTGARGLRSVLESSMRDIMFEIPSDETITSCLITKEVIDGQEEPVITRAGESVPRIPQKKESPADTFRGQETA